MQLQTGLPQSLKNVENALLESAFGGRGSLRTERRTKTAVRLFLIAPSEGGPACRARASGALESAVLGAAPSRRETEFLEVGHSVEMNKSSRDHQDVEQLVGVELEMAHRETR